MMGKAPAFQFYPNDWARDLEEHPLEVEGAWIRICCKLWWSETRGQLSKSIIQWARILRVSEEKTLEILEYIKNEKIGDIPTNLANCNDVVTVESRRMVKDEKQRELTRLRVGRHRRKQTSNDDVTPMKQHSSSSSSSSPAKKEVSKLTSVPPKKKKAPTCPHNKIIEIYHEVLPELPKIQVWDDTSKKNLRMRWSEDPKRQDLDQWKSFFKWIGKSDFLMGRKTDWCCDLMWIVRPTNFAKILNSSYHRNLPKTSRLDAHNKQVLEDWINE